MSDRRLHSIADIVGRLRGQAEQLARELLPGGRREGNEWVAGDFAGSAGRGVGVCIRGAKAGVVADWHAGKYGDLLDLIAWSRTGGDKGQALRFARQWLGLDDGAPVAHVAPAPVDPAVRAARDAEERARKAGAARALWTGAQLIGGTPAAAYLEARGIGPAALGRAPGALRFRPDVWCSERKAPAPAMLASCIRDGKIVACHRTFLEQKPGGGWGKASIRSAKKVLGAIGGAFIPLWRGKSGRPIAEARGDDELVITEGIEDGLTIALHAPEYRVFAAYSLGNIAALRLPPVFGDVILAWDRDGENPAAKEGRRRAVDALLEQGRSVREMVPPDGFKDWNAWWCASRAVGKRA